MTVFLWVFLWKKYEKSLNFSLRDENFWHSGVITRRVTEKVVETQTKSLYRLEGNMELLDAMAAG